jgi:CO dehydrogenase maturation factor
MCSATTKEEMIEASKKIRAYLKANALEVPAIQKVAICGKGGAGKSSLVTLMANAFREKDYRVLVLDTDESNPGLYRMFGFSKGPKPLLTLLSRFSEGESEPNTEWITRREINTGDIPPEYVLSCDGLRFLSVGKIEDPFQGCACSMADITRDLMGKLVVKDNEVILVDMEAGIESFGRGVERNVDTVLMVVEPSFESMALAGKIVYMAEGMGTRRVMAILNKVPSEKVRQRMETELSGKGIKTLGTIYYDLELNEAGFEGTALGHSKAMEDMIAITAKLLDEAK